MTDHPTPATPEATEREARAAVHALTAVGHKMTCFSVEFIKPDNYTGLDKYGSSGKPCDCGSDAKCEATLDAYRAAVAAVESERGRRAERERLVQIVEGMRLTGRKHVGRCTSKCGDGPCSHTAADFHNAALDALLAKLREAK